MQITIKASDRVCFFGRTGSGKTTLARAFLRAVPRFVVLDAKHTFRMRNVPVSSEYSRFRARQIVRLPYDAEDWERVMRRVWRRRRTLLYLDETTLINEEFGTRLSPQLGRAIRTGRELDIGVWIGSQRPKDIPSAVFTEAEHFFIFQLNWHDDRKKVVSFTNSDLLPDLESLKGHEFLYYSVLSNQWTKAELPKGAIGA